MTVIVTPETLIHAEQTLIKHMEDAVGVANNYLHSHENVMGSQTWSGDGGTASLNVAGQVHHDIQQVLSAGSRLASGLGKAAQLMMSHEADTQSSMHGVFGASPAPTSL